MLLGAMERAERRGTSGHDQYAHATVQRIEVADGGFELGAVVQRYFGKYVLLSQRGRHGAQAARVDAQRMLNKKWGTILSQMAILIAPGAGKSCLTGFGPVGSWGKAEASQVGIGHITLRTATVVK